MGIKILNISIVEPLNEVERISLPRYEIVMVFDACLRGGGSFYSWLLPGYLFITKPGSSKEHYWFHSKHNKWWHECSIISWLHGLGGWGSDQTNGSLEGSKSRRYASSCLIELLAASWQWCNSIHSHFFLNTTTLQSHLNYTYVTVIPKVKNLTTLGITVTLKLISDVLRVPQIEKPDYPGSPVLSSFSRDALASHLCECPSITPSSKLVLDFFIHY